MRLELTILTFVMAMVLACVIDVRADAVIATVGVGIAPDAIAIDSVTNKIYVANSASNDVTIIDGATNLSSTTTLASAGQDPGAIAVNPVTNMIYVVNLNDASVTVINGSSAEAIATVSGLANPIAIAVNPVTDKIYVANNSNKTLVANDSVTVIDGATNSTTNVCAGAISRWDSSEPGDE